MPAIARAIAKNRSRAIRATELSEPTSASRKILTFFRELIIEARSTSRFLQLEREYRDLNTSVDQFSDLSDNWDSYGAEKPSLASIAATSEFLMKLKDEFVVPNRVIPSAEGGVAIYFNTGNKTAYIEYRNSEDVILAMYDDKNDPLVVELEKTDADESRAIRLIRNYIAN